jgi:molecular chaperone GrpE (heat shock protein)
MITEIEQKLSEILKDKKNLSNMIEENQRKKEQLLDEVFLDAISVLDAFSREEKVIEDHEWNQSEDSQKAIKRLLNAKKKLNTMLEKYDVKKIVFDDGMSNDDLCSVTDTEPDAEKPNGYILSIEKEGFTRNGHMLRRAEVVIVKN